MSTRLVIKDPDEVVDYVRDWSVGLPDGDTIAESTWVVPVGLTKIEQEPRVSSHDDTTTTVWVSGGTDGQTYPVVNRITTTGGRILEATLRVAVLGGPKASNYVPPAGVTVQTIVVPDAGDEGQVFTRISDGAGWADPAGYAPPSGGIPEADLATAVRTKLNRTPAPPLHPSAPALLGLAATLRRGLRSACVAQLTDSSGTDTDEWFGEFGKALQDRHPGYRLSWRPWNATTDDWDMPTTLVTEDGSLGTGTRAVQLASGALRRPSSTTATGDHDVRVRALPLAGWAPGGAAAVRTLVSRYNASGSNRGWMLQLTEAGRLRWTWSSSGTADAGAAESTVSVTGTDPLWLRVTFDVDNGATGNTATFYTSTDGAAWTQLGAPVVTAGVTTISSGTADYMLGARNSTPTDFFDGDIYWAEIRTGSLATPQASVVPPLPEEWDQATSSATATVTHVGAPVLLLVSAAQSGKNIAWWNDTSRRLRANSPHGQDIIFLSTNHNEGSATGAEWIATYSAWVTDIKARAPGVPIVPLTQNPTFVTAQCPLGQVQARATRGANLCTWGASQAGVWPLDTYPAFTDPATQVETDGIHPTHGAGATSPTGSELWGRYVVDQLLGTVEQ